jgi:D-inositol-3-phosphate glycosyltransferase
MIQRVALLSIHSSPLAPAGSGYAGGMNVYVRRIADGLARTGVEVDVFTRRTDPRSEPVIWLGPGTRLIHVPAGPARVLPKSVLPLHVPRVVASIRDFTEKENLRYDVLHSHYWLSGLVGARVRDDDRAPHVHMFHTLSRVKELHLGSPDPTDSALRGDGERCVINAADAVVGATLEEREYMERLYGRSPREYDVIPPGVDFLDRQPLPQDESRQALGLEADRVVLFVGRFDRIKRLDILLSSFAEVADSARDRARLVMLGQDGGKQEKHVRTMITRLGLQSSVELRGVVPHEDLPTYYAAADVLAMPSVYESFGMAALESMACETPVVAFNAGGLATVIRDGRTGFLARSGDRNHFSQKLHAALAHEDLARVGRRARMSIQGLTWDATVEKTLQLYDRLQARALYAPRRA